MTQLTRWAAPAQWTNSRPNRSFVVQASSLQEMGQPPEGWWRRRRDASGLVGVPTAS